MSAAANMSCLQKTWLSSNKSLSLHTVKAFISRVQSRLLDNLLLLLNDNLSNGERRLYDDDIFDAVLTVFIFSITGLDSPASRSSWRLFH